MQDIKVITKLYELIELIGVDEVYKLLDKLVEEVRKGQQEAWEQDQKYFAGLEKRKEYRDLHPEEEDEI